jgi:hypothetical protein
VLKPTIRLSGLDASVAIKFYGDDARLKRKIFKDVLCSLAQ